jgi:exopolysaccharide biosynthesis polyprenyl glycosylphosphotransferase
MRYFYYPDRIGCSEVSYFPLVFDYNTWRITLKKKFHTTLFVGADWLAAVLSWIIFYTYRKKILAEAPEPLALKLIIQACIMGVCWILLYGFFGFYNDIFRKSRLREFFITVGVVFLGSIIIFFALLLDDEGVHNYREYYRTFTYLFLIHTGITLVIKMSLFTWVKKQVREKKLRLNTLLIGSGANAAEITDELHGSFDLKAYHLIAYLSNAQAHDDLMKSRLRSLGSLDNLEKVIRRCHIEKVIIALEPNEHYLINGILERLEGNAVSIAIIPDIYQLLLGAVKVDYQFDIPLLEINQDLIPYWQKVTKRGIDILASLLVLTLGFPFLTLIALLTKFSSHGPVFFNQERVGKEGKPFKIIKFRSMYVNSEKDGPALSSDKDKRITPWGKIMRKTRLDEFPQFWNVLVGDMSLVGPRPERHFFIEQIVKVAPYYKHLHRVRPGITSLGQVKFGYAENVEEMVKRLKYDILYIENMSLAMDFRIIIYTVLIMFQGRGK